jgi:hypothetical protein
MRCALWNYFMGSAAQDGASNLTTPLSSAKEAATCGHNNFKKLDRNLPWKSF